MDTCTTPLHPDAIRPGSIGRHDPTIHTAAVQPPEHEEYSHSNLRIRTKATKRSMISEDPGRLGSIRRGLRNLAVPW
jgi:hypothetical protein